MNAQLEQIIVARMQFVIIHLEDLIVHVNLVFLVMVFLAVVNFYYLLLILFALFIYL